jgi:hypothetical protein
MGEVVMSKLTDFAKGFIVGLLSTIIICGICAGLVFAHNRDKELINYVEKQLEIEEMREDISSRSIDEFLEIPGVRRASDSAAAEYERKRDEIMERFRNRLVD